MITFQTINELKSAKAVVGDLVQTLDQDAKGDGLGALYEVFAGGAGITMANGLVARSIRKNKSIYPADNFAEALANKSAQIGQVANVKTGHSERTWDYVDLAGAVVDNEKTTAVL